MPPIICIILHLFLQSFYTPANSQDSLFVEGTYQLSIGLYHQADSLLTLSIKEHSNANKHYNRAIARSLLNDAEGFCNDLYVCYHHYRDMRVRDIYLSYCASVDTVFLNARFQLSERKRRYVEIAIQGQYPIAAWGEIIDLKKERTVYVTNLEPTYKRMVTIDETNIVSSFVNLEEERVYTNIYDLDSSEPFFLYGDLSTYINDQLRYSNEINKSLNSSEKEHTILLGEVLIDIKGNVTDAFILPSEKSISREMKEEALRVFKALPSFEPAMVRGRVVPFKMRVSAEFVKPKRTGDVLSGYGLF